MKIALASIITGIVGGLSASACSLLLLRMTSKKLDKAVNYLEAEIERQKKALMNMNNALEVLDREIDNVKKHNKD